MLAQVSLKFLFLHLFARSASFQFRVALLIASFGTNLYVFSSPTPAQVLALVILGLTTMLTLIWDSQCETKHYFLRIVFIFSASVPFVTWFLLAFDFWDGRRNVVLGGFFSTYHFAMDLNFLLLVCVAMDGMRAMKFGANVCLYVFADMRARYVPLETWQEDGLRLGETDFEEPDPATLANQSGNQQPLFGQSPRRTSVRNSSLHSSVIAAGIKTLRVSRRDQKKKRKDPPRIQKLVYLSIAVLESDSLCSLVLGDAWTKTLLAAYRGHTFIMAAFTALFIGVPLTIWSCLVLTGLLPDGLSMLCLLGVFPLTLRLGLKSKPVLFHLLLTLDFWVDLGLSACAAAYLGQALGGFTLRNAVPLMLMVCVFADYRTSDALVNMQYSSPYQPLVFLSIVLPLVFALPLLGNLNLITGLNTEAFPLIIETFTPRDEFLETNPPVGSFQRIRYSQFVFDALLAFGCKLLLDFLHRWRAPNRLTFIYNPVRPRYVKETGNAVEEIEVPQERERDAAAGEEEGDGPFATSGRKTRVGGGSSVAMVSNSKIGIILKSDSQVLRALTEEKE